MAGQNANPCRNSAGSTRKKGKVGSTRKNVPWPSAAIRSLSPVSRHSQIMARMETSGSERISAPHIGLRRATSGEGDDDPRHCCFDDKVKHGTQILRLASTIA